MRTIEDLQREKGRLQKELFRITSEIQEHSGSELSTGSNSKIVIPASKSGYLFKWQDRYIGWGGTKWDLRFVRLERGRLSYYKSHDDSAPRYLLTLKNCAIRDDGNKPNKRFRVKNNEMQVNENTPGAYYHVFSIYQRSGTHENSAAELDKEDDIVPILRFSTENLGQKMQWMELLEESCEYCDSEHFDEHEVGPLLYQTPNLPPVGRNTKGTLPALYFAPTPARLSRLPSHTTLTMKRSRLKLNKSKEAAKSNSKRKSDYPPSKAMHRGAEPSYLSDEAPMQNYRGLLNLGLIILVISNFRILLETMREYGFVTAHGFFAGSGKDYTFIWEDEVDIHFICGMVMLNVFVVLAYFIEKCASRQLWSEWISIALHIINTNLALFLPMTIVWTQIENPVNGAILLMTATVLWMKLVSYVHANADYRHFPERSKYAAASFIQNVDEDSKTMSYPSNITLSNIYYFWFAPSLVYQIIFPKLAIRDVQKIISLLLRLFLSFVLMIFLVAQVVSPNLNAMLEELQSGDNGLFTVHIFAEYLLKLGIASTYIWLLVFYGFFHVFLNLLAQLLRFGDRVFYRDWWNSSNLSSYWRLWNLPVHYWLVRHLYFPCIRVGLSKSAAMFIVFFFSAVVHEMLISIPFHMIRSYSFLGMMSQIPLVYITKHFDKVRPGSSIGNFIFWMSFCILGQPMAIILYTIDYWKLKSGDFPLNECTTWICDSENSHFLSSFFIKKGAEEL